MPDTLDTFTRAYIGAALWSTTDDDGEPLDSNYDASDIAPETLAANERSYTGQYDRPSYEESRAGHDFWLTRNRHGAGFWDRGLGAIGDKIADVARSWGGVDLYVGGDGRIYQA